MQLISLIPGAIVGSIIFFILNRIFTIYYFGFKGMFLMWVGCVAVSSVVLSMLWEVITGNIIMILVVLVILVVAVILVGKLLNSLITKKKKLQQSGNQVPNQAQAEVNNTSTPIETKLGDNDQHQESLVEKAVCPQCGYIGQSGKFCSKCGAKLATHKICTACGQSVHFTDKFCNKCGSATST